MSIIDTLRSLLNVSPGASVGDVYQQTPQPKMHFHATCHTCRRYHEMLVAVVDLPTEIARWAEKHPLPNHASEYHSRYRLLPRGLFDRAFSWFNITPWWLDYSPNSDIKIAYAASAAYTCGVHVTPLASSSTGVLGRESTAVSNTSGLHLDYLVGGKITTGTSPTAGVISVYLYGSIDDTPTYPDVLDGTDSDETFTSADIRNAGTTFFAETVTDTTSNRTYWLRPQGIMASFGGWVPKNHGLFVTHTTVAALNSTAGNHGLSYTPVYRTV